MLAMVAQNFSTMYLSKILNGTNTERQTVTVALTRSIDDLVKVGQSRIALYPAGHLAANAVKLNIWNPAFKYKKF